MHRLGADGHGRCPRHLLGQLTPCPLLTQRSTALLRNATHSRALTTDTTAGICAALTSASGETTGKRSDSEAPPPPSTHTSVAPAAAGHRRWPGVIRFCRIALPTCRPPLVVFPIPVAEVILSYFFSIYYKNKMLKKAYLWRLKLAKLRIVNWSRFLQSANRHEVEFPSARSCTRDLMAASFACRFRCIDDSVRVRTGATILDTGPTKPKRL